MQPSSNLTNLQGTVDFFRINKSHILVTANISGISVNKNIQHGLHIHEFGDLSTNNASAVGSHYIGNGKDLHACENTTLRHEGDMGNWVVSNGTIKQKKYLNLIQLLGNHSIIGRSVILHSFTDDCKTTSSSQHRLGQCAIGISSNYTKKEVAVNSHAYTKAYCKLQNSSFSNVPNIGEFWFEQTQSGLHIWGYVMLQGSRHGIHIHFYGDLSAPDLSSAGLHLSITDQIHAFPNDSIHHVGDLGNIEPNSTAPSWYNSVFESGIYLSGTKSILGRSLIIHRDADDGRTQPSGNSSVRIAGCVIGIANPNFWNPKNAPFPPIIYSQSGNALSLTAKLSIVAACFLTCLALGVIAAFFLYRYRKGKALHQDPGFLKLEANSEEL